MSVDEAPVPSGTEDDESLDSELARALETYLGAVEAGRPDDLERLAAEHPAIAEQIRSCLGVLRLAGRVEGKAEADTSCDWAMDSPSRLCWEISGFSVRSVGAAWGSSTRPSRSHSSARWP